MQRILPILQILISCWEVWMCYELLYSTILEKECLRKKDKILIYGNIILWGMGIAYNHNFAFFSLTMFYLAILVTGLCVYAVKKREILLIIGMVASYYSLVAVMDYFIAFRSMYYLDRMGIDFYITVYSSSTYIQALLLFIVRMLIFLGITLVRKQLVLHKGELGRYKYPILAMGGILIMIVKRYQFDLYRMAAGKQDVQGGFAGTSMLLLVSIVLLVTIGILINDSVRKKNEILSLRDEMQNKWYQNVQRELEQERIRIHDVKQHFLILQAYEKEKDWENLHQYLEKIGERYIETSIPACTGNRILDMIIYQKRIKADQKNIKWRTHVTKLENLPMSEEEIVSLFGNLLDNAIEACEQIKDNERWIQIQFSRQKRILNMEILNSIEKIPREENGRLVSSKSNKRQHGYGMKSVRQIVDRNGGEFSYQIRGKEFCARITFFDL